MERQLTILAVIILNIVLYGGLLLLLMTPGSSTYVYPSVFAIMIISNVLAYFACKRWPEQRLVWSVGFAIVPFFFGIRALYLGSGMIGWAAPIGYGVYIFLTSSYAGYYGVIAKLKAEGKTE